MSNISFMANYTYVNGALAPMIKCDPYFYTRQLQDLLLLNGILILGYLFIMHDNEKIPKRARDVYLFIMVCLIIGAYTMTFYRG
jgi:hypothetical protein